MSKPPRSLRVARFGTYEADLAAAELRKNGKRIKLQDRPFDVLAILLERPGEMVSREEFRNRIWPADTFVDFDHSLNVSINKLRAALDDTADNPRFVATVGRRGYRFIAPVVNSAPVAGTPSEAETASAQARLNEPPSIAEHGDRQRPAWHPRSALAAALLLSGFLVVLFLFKMNGSRFTPSIKPQPAEAAQPVAGVRLRPSVAVLGFQNLSGHPDAAWLSTGISEMLATELGTGEKLRMISSDDVSQVRINLSLPSTDALSKSNLRRVRENTGADLVVLGSYTALGIESDAPIRLDLRVQDAVSGETVTWLSQTGTRSNLFGLVSAAGASLRKKLGIEDVSQEQGESVRASLPSDPEAARLYSEGLSKLQFFDGQAASDLLVRATAIERKFPFAHAALAEAWSRLGYDNKAKAEAQEAFRLSTSLPSVERLSIEGRYRIIMHDWDQAANVYRVLSELFPDDLESGLHLASAQSGGTKARDALDTVARLRKLPPPLRDDPRIDLAEAVAWNSMGDFSEESPVIARMVDKARALSARQLLAEGLRRQCWVYNNIGDQEKAAAACREAQQIYAAIGNRRGEADALRTLGDTIGASDHSGAIKFFEEALSIQEQIGDVAGQAAALNEMGVQYANLGDHVTAMRNYQRSLSLYRGVDDKVHAITLLGNVANERLGLGQLEQAEQSYREVLRAAEKFGVSYNAGTAAYNLGTIRQVRGDLSGAKKWFQRSLAVFQEKDDRFSRTYSLYSLGEVAMLQGDLVGARKLLEQSATERDQVQDVSGATESRLDLADLSLEEGRPPQEAEKLARAATQQSHDAKVVEDEARAYATLSRALLAEGKAADALQAANMANVVASKSQNPETRLATQVSSARVRFLAGKEDRTSAVLATKDIERARGEAAKFGYMQTQMEARLGVGEIDMKSGAVDAGRKHLKELETDARAHGFDLIARKAAAAAHLEKQF